MKSSCPVLADLCVLCGAPVPEGEQVCPNCRAALLEPDGPPEARPFDLSDPVGERRGCPKKRIP